MYWQASQAISEFATNPDKLGLITYKQIETINKWNALKQKLQRRAKKYIYLGRGAEKENRPNTHIDNISRMIYGLVNQQGAANTAIVLG